VALRAGNRGVLPCQWETRGAVIERSGSPGGNGMTRGALCGRGWEPRGDVIRHVPADGRRALERSRMATITIRGI
jgi:hypothetical protein